MNMQIQTKYKDEINKELQDMPAEDMPKLLEIIHYLKTGMKVSSKKEKVKKGRDPLFDFREDCRRDRDQRPCGAS